MWLGRPRKLAVPSPAGDVNMVSPVSTFLLNILTLMIEDCHKIFEDPWRWSKFVTGSLKILKRFSPGINSYRLGRFLRCATTSFNPRSVSVNQTALWEFVAVAVASYAPNGLHKKSQTESRSLERSFLLTASTLLRMMAHSSINFCPGQARKYYPDLKSHYLRWNSKDCRILIYL